MHLIIKKSIIMTIEGINNNSLSVQIKTSIKRGLNKLAPPQKNKYAKADRRYKNNNLFF